MAFDTRDSRDARIAAALAAVAPQLAAYRSALAGALSRAAALIEPDTHQRVRVELGDFAAGRVNAEGFAALAARAALDVEAHARVERALAVLHALNQADDSAVIADVPSGGSLRREVAMTLARLGCAFGAGRAIEEARSARFDPAMHRQLLDLWPFELWSKSERRIAPPVVATVDAADLRVAGLCEFLDGAVRIVLVVRGECRPAPLARLVSPGVCVIQTDAAATSLNRIGKGSGPAIAALLEGDVAHFVHDPDAGASSWQRLSITKRPGAEPKRSIGGWSAWQQRDELQMLNALATPPTLPDLTAAEAVGTNGASGDPAQRLAAWLLQEAQLDGALKS